MTGAFRYAASNAQVRARRSTLLSPDDWRALRAQPDVESIAARLDGTRFGPAVPREAASLELHLKAAVAAEAVALASLLHGDPLAVLRAYARRFELANLKTVLRCHHFDIPPARAASLLVPLPASALPWTDLLGASGVAGVADALAGTPYQHPLRTVLEQGGETTPFALEVALDLAYFQHLVWTILRLGGADAAAAERLLGSWIAIENLSWAFRYRRLAGLTPEETVNYTLHRAFGAGLDAVLRVVTGASVADEAARLGFRVDATASVDEALVELELAATRRRFDAAERSFAGSMFDLGGALAQLTLVEAEARDLVALIEGRVVGLDDAGIASRLVGSPERRGER